MGKNEKKLTFIESAKIRMSDSRVMSRDLERDAQMLRLTFPHVHQNMKAYQNMQANAEWWALLADSVGGDMSKYEKLDEILAQLRQHVNLKDIDYGTNLFKQYTDNTILHPLQSWDMERTADYYSPEELDSLSVFDSTALYFEFPAYTGAILYLKPLRTSLLYICLEVGIQIIDNRVAYRFPRKDRKPYATIPLVQFQQGTQDRCFNQILSQYCSTAMWTPPFAKMHFHLYGMV